MRMKIKTTFIYSGLMALSLLGFIVPTISQAADIDADTEKQVMELYAAYEEIQNLSTTYSGRWAPTPKGDLPAQLETAKKIEEIIVPKANAIIKSLTAKHGPWNGWNTLMSGKLKGKGDNGRPLSPWNYAREFETEIQGNPAKFREFAFGTLVNNIETVLSRSSSNQRQGPMGMDTHDLYDFVREADNVAKIEQYGSEEQKAVVQKFKDAHKALMEQQIVDVDAYRMPTPDTTPEKFDADPNDYDGLDPEAARNAMLEYFSRKKIEFHNLHVSSKWKVAKSNVLGNPIKWYINAWVTLPRSFKEGRETELAHIFSGDKVAYSTLYTFYTAETSDVKREGPFAEATPGNLYFIRDANLPSSGQSSSSSGSDSSSGASFGGLIFQIIMGLALVASGLLLSAPLVRVKIPALAPVYEKLTPLRALIGVATLLIGLAWLAMSLLSPLSNILPIVAAIISGLYLGFELLLKKPAKGASDQLGEKGSAAADAAVEKAQALLEKNADKLKLIEAQQVPIGITCLVLGLLHIAIGNVMFL
jgi:hypothetical protein